MGYNVCIIGGGLAGSEAALQLGMRGVCVTLLEARPLVGNPVHKTDLCAELVCSNSLKSEKEASAAGMLKEELRVLRSQLYSAALSTRVPAGGALAVDRTLFAQRVTSDIAKCEFIDLVRGEAVAIESDGVTLLADGGRLGPFDAVVVATGPLTSNAFAEWIASATGSGSLSFYDAAAPIVMADSIDRSKVFRQSRYEASEGDYLNAPFDKDEYDRFINALVGAERVVSKQFENSELFQACQPIEEIARKGHDAPRFGPLKPVGLTDPATGRRPWAALQLRAEDAQGNSYNMVGFQTNLTFPEQKRVFRMIPGLDHVEFARFGVMHRNTFLDAPSVMNADQSLRLESSPAFVPVYLAGQVSGTEGYCEAIRSGLQAAIQVAARLKGRSTPRVPTFTVYGALLEYATAASTVDYQPMHVNFGIMPPLDNRIRNKAARYEAYARRGSDALHSYALELDRLGVAL